MADTPLTTPPSKANLLRNDSPGLHRYQAVMRGCRHRKRVHRSTIEAKRKVKALRAAVGREKVKRERYSMLPIQKKLRTLQDERYKLLQHVSEMTQDNRGLEALIANPEAASHLRRTQQDLRHTQQDLNKQVARLHTHLRRLQDESQSKKDERNAQLKAKVRDLELAVKLAGRRVDEMKDILRDV